VFNGGSAPTLDSETLYNSRSGFPERSRIFLPVTGLSADALSLGSPADTALGIPAQETIAAKAATDTSARNPLLISDLKN
jgi:hypothetical protein